MNTHETIQQFAKMLRNLEGWLDKATAHATAKSFDVDVLVQARLAPDQYAFVRQVQASCDSAKFAAAYLSGRKAPVHPDTEKSFAELRERIRACLSFLDSIPRDEYGPATERKVSPPWLGGKWIRGDEYLAQAAIPNFYFHITTAYAILRHNGVDVGKMDYIGSVPTHD